MVTAFLSALFVGVYGGCNWLAAHREEVGTWYYAWERFIPFVPWTIIPYMSIDLFFVAAPFFCRNNDELRTLARRITFAILMAGGFFLLIPLQLAVLRPQPAGWTAPVFAFLHGFDQPFNLFPSLHITLRTILGVHYFRHSKGPWKIAVHVWFSLIGLSTLLTYQHHIVDVIGGFVLALLCFYLFREGEPATETQPNLRVGTWYGAGSLALVLVALFSRPGAAILLWPALAMGLVAAAYYGFAPSVFRKRGGRLPPAARIVLGPVLLGQRLSRWHYRRQCDPWNKITPNVWIGVHLHEHEAREARRRGVTAVLDLTVEFPEAPAFLELPYCNLPVLDLTAPSPGQLRQAAEFITEHAASGKVYVHCKAGYSRSAAAVGAYLLASDRAATLRECILLLRGARPSIVIRPEIEKALGAFAKRLRAERSREPVHSAAK
jgi:membrane-associated phospholipid phosphatase